jgi:predicted MFS family arabinose efflux permease
VETIFVSVAPHDLVTHAMDDLVGHLLSAHSLWGVVVALLLLLLLRRRRRRLLCGWNYS